MPREMARLRRRGHARNISTALDTTSSTPSSPFLQDWEAAAQFPRQGGMPPCISRAGWAQEKPVPRQAEPWGVCSWGVSPQQRHSAALSTVLACPLPVRDANAEGLSLEHWSWQPQVAPCTPCRSLSPRTHVAPQGGGSALGPPKCSGPLFPGRQINLGSCGLQLMVLLGDSLGAAWPQNLEELGRGTVWGEEGQDWLHQPCCCLWDSRHHGGNTFPFPPGLAFSCAGSEHLHTLLQPHRKLRALPGMGLTSGLLLGPLPAGSSPQLVSPATAHSQCWPTLRFVTLFCKQESWDGDKDRACKVLGVGWLQERSAPPAGALLVLTRPAQGQAEQAACPGSFLPRRPAGSRRQQKRSLRLLHHLRAGGGRQAPLRLLFSGLGGLLHT